VIYSRVQRFWDAVPVFEVANGFVLDTIMVDEQALFFRWKGWEVWFFPGVLLILAESIDPVYYRLHAI
jgi:hypothetical protein